MSGAFLGRAGVARSRMFGSPVMRGWASVAEDHRTTWLPLAEESWSFVANGGRASARGRERPA